MWKFGRYEPKMSDILSRAAECLNDRAISNYIQKIVRQSMDEELERRGGVGKIAEVTYEQFCDCYDKAQDGFQLGYAAKEEVSVTKRWLAIISIMNAVSLVVALTALLLR